MSQSKVKSGSIIGAGDRVAPYDAMVYKDGTYTIAVDGDGNVIKKVLSSLNTDDVVIQAAIDHLAGVGGTINIDIGTYNYQSNISLVENISIIGKGIQKTILKYVGAIPTVRRLEIFDISNVEIGCLTVETGFIYVGYFTGENDNIYIHDVEIYEGQYDSSLFIYGTEGKLSNCTIENCIANRCYGMGFLLHRNPTKTSYLYNTTLINCRAIDCGRYARDGQYVCGFSLESGIHRNVKLIGCHSEGSWLSGFHQEGNTGTTIPEQVMYIGCSSCDNSQRTKLSNGLVDNEDLTQSVPITCSFVDGGKTGVAGIPLHIRIHSSTITAFSVTITQGALIETVDETTYLTTNPTGSLYNFYTVSSAWIDSSTLDSVIVNSVVGASAGDTICVGQDPYRQHAWGFNTRNSTLIGCSAKDEYPERDYFPQTEKYPGVYINNTTCFTHTNPVIAKEHLLSTPKLANWLLDKLGSPVLVLPFYTVYSNINYDYTRNQKQYVQNIEYGKNAPLFINVVKNIMFKEFDGVSNYITGVVNDTDLDFGDGVIDIAFSVNVLVKFNNVESRAILNKWNEKPGAEEREWSIFTDSSGYLTVQLYDESEDAYIGRQYQTRLTEYVIYILNVTYDGSGDSSGIKIYLDGEQVDDADYESGSYVAMESIVENMRIGHVRTGESTYDRYFYGELACPCISLKEMSEDEVWLMYMKFKDCLGV